MDPCVPIATLPPCYHQCFTEHGTGKDIYQCARTHACCWPWSVNLLDVRCKLYLGVVMIQYVDTQRRRQQSRFALLQWWRCSMSEGDTAGADDPVRGIPAGPVPTAGARAADKPMSEGDAAGAGGSGSRYSGGGEASGWRPGC